VVVKSIHFYFISLTDGLCIAALFPKYIAMEPQSTQVEHSDAALPHLLSARRSTTLADSEGLIRHKCNEAIAACRADVKELRQLVKAGTSFREHCAVLLGAAQSVTSHLEEVPCSADLDITHLKALHQLIRRAHTAIIKGQGLVKAYANKNTVSKIFVLDVPDKFEALTDELDAISRQTETIEDDYGGGGVLSGTLSVISGTATHLPTSNKSKSMALASTHPGSLASHPTTENMQADGGATALSMDGEATAAALPSLMSAACINITSNSIRSSASFRNTSLMVGSRRMPPQAMVARRIKKGSRFAEVTSMMFIPPAEAVHHHANDEEEDKEEEEDEGGEKKEKKQRSSSGRKEEEEGQKLGRLWYFVKKPFIHGTLMMMDLSEEKVTEVKQAKRTPKITCMHYDPINGLLWTGHVDGCVRVWDEKACAACCKPLYIYGSRTFSPPSVHCITVDEVGLCWVGTTSGRVVKIGFSEDKQSLEVQEQCPSLLEHGEDALAHDGPVHSVAAAGGRVYTSGGTSAFVTFNQWGRDGSLLSKKVMKKIVNGTVTSMLFTSPFVRIHVPRVNVQGYNHTGSDYSLPSSSTMSQSGGGGDGIGGVSGSSGGVTANTDEIPQAWQLLTGHSNGVIMVWAMVQKNVLEPALIIGPKGPPICGLTVCESLGMICKAHTNGDLVVMPIPHFNGPQAIPAICYSSFNEQQGQKIEYINKKVDDEALRRSVIKASSGSGLSSMVGGMGRNGVITLSNWGQMKMYPTAELRAVAAEDKLDFVVPEYASEEQRPITLYNPPDVNEAVQALIEFQNSSLHSIGNASFSHDTTSAVMLAAEKNKASLFTGGDADRWLIAAQDLETVRVIGEGAFGKVYQGTFNQTDVAIKILTKDALLSLGNKLSTVISQGTGLIQKTGNNNANGTTSTEAADDDIPASVIKTLEQEVSIMMKIRHPNIILFMGMCLKPPCIVTEYCNRGSLYDLLRDARRVPALAAQLSWSRRLSMAVDAARGMLCLHSHKPSIVHRDLKSPNLLVDKHWHAKVTDFNLSRISDDINTHQAAVQSSLVANNPRWHSPEVIKAHCYDKAADVYAFALILWELLTWELPFAAMSPYQIMLGVGEHGLRPEIPAPFSKQAADLIGGDVPSQIGDAYRQLMKDCWTHIPGDRPSFETIILRLRAMEDVLVSDKKAALEKKKKMLLNQLTRSASVRVEQQQGGGDGQAPATAAAVAGVARPPPIVSPFDAPSDAAAATREKEVVEAPAVVIASPFDSPLVSAEIVKPVVRSPFEEEEEEEAQPATTTREKEVVEAAPVRIKSPFDEDGDSVADIMDSNTVTGGSSDITQLQSRGMIDSVKESDGGKMSSRDGSKRSNGKSTGGGSDTKSLTERLKSLRKSTSANK
jgi:serine/threonine protein kinase